jgi:hypothetical protein
MAQESELRRRNKAGSVTEGVEQAGEAGSMKDTPGKQSQDRDKVLGRTPDGIGERAFRQM